MNTLKSNRVLLQSVRIFLKRVPLYFLVFFIFCCCIPVMVFASGTVTLSSNQVRLGESIDLIFTADQPITVAPDLGDLQSSVRIGAQRQLSNTSVINGRVSQSYQLIFTLFPKKEGRLKVGPFDFNGTKTEVLFLTVEKMLPLSENGLDTTKKKGTLSLMASLSSDKIYEGETALYTVNLSESVGLMNASIGAPSTEGLSVISVQEGSISQKIQDNQKINEISYPFLLVPNQAGVYQIPSAELFAFMPDVNAGTSKETPLSRFLEDDFFFDVFGSAKKEIYLQTNPVTLTVLPKPSDWQGWWLPSTNVVLTENYRIPEKIRVGDTIERSVLLSVAGIEASKLPLLVQPVSDDFKIYANPEKRQTDLVNNQPVGTQDITFVLMPIKSGKLKIPAVTISWFNTKTAQKMDATLPEMEIDVLPAENQALSLENKEIETLDTSLKTKVSGVLGSVNDTTQRISINKEIPVCGFKSIVLSIYENLNWFKVLLFIAILIVVGTLILLCIWKCRRRKIFISMEKQLVEKKKTKPLPDLYPF